MYRHKLRLVSYIIHNEKLSNSPLLIARARLQVLLGSVNTSIKLNSFTPMSLVYDMRNVASPVFTRSHSKSVKFIQANISLWFTHNGCYPRRRWDEELCTESMPDGITSLRPSVLLPKTSVYRSNFWYCATGSKSSYLFHFNAECVL